MFDEGFYRKFRSQTPSNYLKWIDRYHYQAEELQNLIQINNKPLTVMTFDLSAAQSVSKQLDIPGRGFALYGFTTGDATKTVDDSAFVKIRINKDLVEAEFPGKHHRGYRGDFFRLFLQWPAQANVSMDLVIHNFDDRQWQGGIGAT